MIDLGKLFGGDTAGAFSGNGFGDAAQGLGGLASLAGGLIGGNAAAAAGQAQSNAYLENAQTAGTNAAVTRLNLTDQQELRDYQTNRLIGRQQALYAGANVNPGSGSPLDVLSDTIDQARREAQLRLQAGDFAALSGRQQALYDTQSAAAARQAGKTDQTASSLGGIGTAASIAAKIFTL